MASQKHVQPPTAKKSRRQLPTKTKQEILNRLQNGETAASLAHAYDVNESTIRRRSKKLEKPAKRTKKSHPLKMKLEILNRLERGETAASIGRAYSVSESTVRSIRNNEKLLRQSGGNSSHSSLSITSRTRDPLLERTEKILSDWIAEKNQDAMPLTSKIIRQQALTIHRHLVKEDGASSSFNASKGWFENFKRRQSLQHIEFQLNSESGITLQGHVTGSARNGRTRSTQPLKTYSVSEENIDIKEEPSFDDPSILDNPSEPSFEHLNELFERADQLIQFALEVDPNSERSVKFKEQISEAMRVYRGGCEEEVLDSERIEYISTRAGACSELCDDDPLALL